MTARILNIANVRRVTRDGEEELIEFAPGVNVLLGENNAGKTMWMTLIDFLFGDDATPKNALDELADHYSAASMQIGIGDRLHVIEREWGDDPAHGRLLIDDRSVSGEQFSEFMLSALGIPELRFPRGNPLAPRAWPRLTWRTLLRQIYRREDSWSEIAHRQPEGEQFAVLAQFVGIASAVFSPEFASLADTVKKRNDLIVRKQHFEEMLDEVGRTMVSVADAPSSVNAESIASAIEVLMQETQSKSDEREHVLRGVASSLSLKTPGDQEQVALVGSILGQTRLRREALAEDALRGRKRVEELDEYRRELSDELNKLRRAQVAGDLIGPLRVTHCPVCDQSVEERTRVEGECFLCQQPVTTQVAAESHERMQFEITQLTEELREVGLLRERAERDASEANRLTVDAEDEIARAQLELEQLTSAVSWVVPTDVGELDRAIGSLAERTRQLQRLRGTLDLRDQITREIDRLRLEVGELEGAVAVRQAEPRFEAIGDELAAAMMSYLNALDATGQLRWGQRRITVDVTAEDILILVDGKRWTKALGANLRAYFLMSLQYALMKLSGTEPFNYPGFALLDFPANLGQHTGLSDDENYLLAPFIELLARPVLAGTQVIAAGRSFQGLEGAHLIPLGAAY